VQFLAETIDRLQPARVRERHRRLGPAVELERVGRGKRNVKGAATLAGFLRPAPDAAALAMFGPHADEIAAALARRDAQPLHPHQVGPSVREHVVDRSLS
jgi:hypothetical protein